MLSKMCDVQVLWTLTLLTLFVNWQGALNSPPIYCFWGVGSQKMPFFKNLDFWKMWFFKFLGRQRKIFSIGSVTPINPTPVGGDVFRPPYRKMAITPKNNDPKEPKLCDFSYISMTNPPIPFWGLKMAKKGFL